jgi:hypothetical protein
MPEDVDFPQFEVKLQANCRSKFTIDKHEIGKLSDFLLDQRWKGKLEVTYPGNGGITLVTFDETKPMSEAQEENNS